ncbi:unnamed protein product [Nesidiocoris tenuis]|uniref:Uncharacterized protein n=1 Tax=Nesidiocoris tenuis TaxID=355587 RepID=A0A6H5H6S0_9HEMI|nr:unnamed protein product [Nesidiocoris tenuis]
MRWPRENRHTYRLGRYGNKVCRRKKRNPPPDVKTSLTMISVEWQCATVPRTAPYANSPGAHMLGRLSVVSRSSMLPLTNPANFFSRAKTNDNGLKTVFTFRSRAVGTDFAIQPFCLRAVRTVDPISRSVLGWKIRAYPTTILNPVPTQYSERLSCYSPPGIAV